VNVQFLCSGDINWKDPIQFAFGAISIVTLAVYTLAPIYMTVFFRANVKKFHLSTFKLRYNEAINDLNQKGNSSPNYFIIFCFRRLAINLLIVVLPSYSSSQVMLYIFQNQMVVISLGFTSIYKLAFNRRLDYFNEAIMLVTGYHLFCFSDFVPKAATRY